MTKKDTSTPAQDIEGEVPQYRLTEPAYINDVHYDQSLIDAKRAVIYHEGPPAHFMYPMNDAARAMVKKHKPKHIDPLAALTVVGAAPTAPPQPQAGTALEPAS